MSQKYEFAGMDADVGIVTPCPSCGRRTLFVSDDGDLICSAKACLAPSVESCIKELESRLAAAEADAGVPPPCPECGTEVDWVEDYGGYSIECCMKAPPGCTYTTKWFHTREAAYREHYRNVKERKTA